MPYRQLYFFYLFYTVALNSTAQSQFVYQRGHTGAISAIEISPDKKYLATGGEDGQVLLWDLNTKNVFSRFTPLRNEIDDIVFHPSKPWLAAIDANGTIVIWDLNSEKAISKHYRTLDGLISTQLAKKKDTVHFNPQFGRIFGGGIAFVDNQLIVGFSSGLSKDISSAFKIDVENNTVKPILGLPRNDYDEILGIKQFEPIIDDELLVLTDEFGRGELLIYNLNEERLSGKLLKADDIENFCINKALHLVAVNVADNQTEIFDYQSKKKLTTINASGVMAWEDSLLWISETSHITSFNIKTKNYQNQFGTTGSASSLIIVPETDCLIIHYRFEGVQIFSPVKLREAASLDQFKNNHKDGYRNEYVTDLSFLNDSIFVLGLQNKNYKNEIYLWQEKNKKAIRIFDKEGARYVGVDANKNLIIGSDLDSITKVNEYFNERYDVNTIDFFNGLPEKASLWKSYYPNDVLGIQQKQNVILFQEVKASDTANIYVVNYLTNDTAATFHVNTLYAKGYFEPISGNIALVSRSNERIHFYNQKYSTTPFYKIEGSTFKVLDFDGKKRLLITMDYDSTIVINLHYPQKSVNISASGILSNGVFHPTEPWVFTSTELLYEGVECYDYSSKRKIGGYALREEVSKDYFSSIDKMAMNSSGDKLLISYETNKVFALEISGSGKLESLGEQIEVITDINQQDNYLFLGQGYNGANIINLSRLVNSRSIIGSLAKQDGGKVAVKIKNDYATIYQINNNYNLQDYKNHTSLRVIRIDLLNEDADKTIAEYDLVTGKNLSILEIIGDRYLVCFNSFSLWDRHKSYSGLYIFDLIKKKFLIENPEAQFQGLNTEKDEKLFFYSMHTLLTWQYGESRLTEVDISPNFISMGVAMGAAFPNTNRGLFKSEIDQIFEIDPSSGKRLDSISNAKQMEGISLLQSMNDSMLWVSGYSVPDSTYVLGKLNVLTKTWDEQRVLLADKPIMLELSANKKLLFVSLFNGQLIIINAQKGDFLAQMVIDKKGDLVIWNKDGNFHATNSSLEPYKLKYDNRLFSTQSVELTKKRPDIILKSLGFTSPELLAIYEEAIAKRQLLNTETSVIDYANFPFVDLASLHESDTENVMHANFSNYHKGNEENLLEVSINGVAERYVLRDSLNLPIHLAKGSNQVAYGLVNPTYGSYPKQELVIQSEKEAINKNLIVCVLSVSTYLDETKSLTYAVKDGQDVLNMMNQQKAEYDTVITHTLYNEDVTLIKIDSMFRNISATEHDKVVFFLSGHGLLDDDLNFYFATYDIDFKNPKGKGLPFSTLQRYISNFTSPQKLLLIDACQSGLVDASKRLKDTSPSKPGITPIREHSFTGKGAEEMVSENEITLQNSFVLMRELFSDLSSNSGVETITAASGDSWALESSQWKNGAFTFVLKKALINFEADENKDGIISIKELKNYLLTEVEILTNGAQRATSRSANKGISWNIWE